MIDTNHHDEAVTIAPAALAKNVSAFGKSANYLISRDIIRIILKAEATVSTQKNPSALTQNISPKAELIFPRKNLHNFTFSEQETVLEYRKNSDVLLKISVLPLTRKVIGQVIVNKNRNIAQNSVSNSAFSFSYNIQKNTQILFSKFIETGWAFANSVQQDPTPKRLTTTTDRPIAKTAILATPSPSLLPNAASVPKEPSPKRPALLPLKQDQEALIKPETKTLPSKLNKKGTTKLSLFRPAKLLDKQLLRTPLHNLQNNISNKKIFDIFLKSKKKKILQQITPRVKAGTSLSLLYPDFRNYTLIKKVSAYQEKEIQHNRVQAGYYIWQEDDKIITSSSTKLMPLRVAENILQKHMVLKPARPQERYLKQLNATYKTAIAQPFALDQKSLRRLRQLLRLARTELKQNNSNFAISPPEYGRALTYLRSWVTYDYLKKFSVSKFQKYYRNVERIQGRGKYAHLKITQILGLQDTGRIIENRNFLNHYHYAIESAAKKHPTIPREWIEHIIWIETKGDPRAISHAGAYGLMQLLPNVFMGKGEKRAKSHKLAFAQSINPFNAEQNIERGTAFLESLVDYFGDVIKKYPPKTRKQIIFHAYNRGPTKVKQLVRSYGLGYVAHLPLETRLYFSRLDDFPL